MTFWNKEPIKYYFMFQNDFFYCAFLPLFSFSWIIFFAIIYFYIIIFHYKFCIVVQVSKEFYSGLFIVRFDIDRIKIEFLLWIFRVFIEEWSYSIQIIERILFVSFKAFNLKNIPKTRSSKKVMQWLLFRLFWEIN